MKPTNEDFDWKKFLKDCETQCFDCGSANIKLIKIDDGIVFCEPCFRIAKEDYPK